MRVAGSTVRMLCIWTRPKRWAATTLWGSVPGSEAKPSPWASHKGHSQYKKCGRGLASDGGLTVNEDVECYDVIASRLAPTVVLGVVKGQRRSATTPISTSTTNNTGARL